MFGAHDSDKTAATLQRLYRNELAAVETYEQALLHTADLRKASSLRQIWIDHRNAAEALGRCLQQRGVPIPGESGLRGSISKAAEATAAAMPGESMMLRMLTEGEAMAANRYRSALADHEVADEIKRLIRADLVQRCEQHCATLTQLRELRA